MILSDEWENLRGAIYVKNSNQMSFWAVKLVETFLFFSTFDRKIQNW